MVLIYGFTNSRQKFFTVHAGVVSFGPVVSQSICPGVLSCRLAFEEPLAPAEVLFAAR